MKTYVLIILFFCRTGFAIAQGDTASFTLKQAFEQLEESWPLGDKAYLQQRITEWNHTLAGSGRLPEIRLNASMSYRSDVTELPFSSPGVDPPIFSKDHYNVSLEVIQSLYDGGRTRFIREAEEHAGTAEQAQIQAQFLGVREQMEQVWFGILMVQKQEEVLVLLHDDISKQLDRVESLVQNGVLLPSDAMVLKAELISIEQELAGTRGNIHSGYHILSELLGVDIPTDTQLETPNINELSVDLPTDFNRPEYDLFEANEQRIESQKQLSSADMLPAVSFFATTAYGRPGLDVFDDDLQFFWILGARAQWSFRNTRNASINREILNLQKRLIDTDRDIFTRQLQATLRETEEEIVAIRKQIEQDIEVLRLRNDIVTEKSSQLEQGAITSTDFITELNSESRARINLEIRKIRLARALAEFRTKQGITWN